MLSPNLLPPPRLVASGGPVTRAVQAGRGDVNAERQALHTLRAAIIARIQADADLLDRVEIAIATRRAGGAA